MRHCSDKVAKLENSDKYTMDTQGARDCMTVPEGTVELEPCAFYECAVRTVILPASLQRIGDCAFYGCAGLEQVIFAPGSALSSIGDSAFYGCGALRECRLPAGLMVIGNHAFFQCRDLDVRQWPAALRSIGREAFSGCGSLTEAGLGAQITSDVPDSDPSLFRLRCGRSEGKPSEAAGA